MYWDVSRNPIHFAEGEQQKDTAEAALKHEILQIWKCEKLNCFKG